MSFRSRVIALFVCTWTISAAQAQEPPARVGADIAAKSLASGKRYSRSISQANKDLISSGQLKVQDESKIVVVSDQSLEGLAARKEVFFAFVRAQPQVVPLPDALQQVGKPGETATVLRQDVFAPGSSGEAVRVQAYVRNGTGLSYVGARNRFEGTFSVALAYADGSRQETLTAPVPIAISALAADSIDPQQMQLQDVGGWHPVLLAVRSPEVPYRISVSAGARDAGNTIELPVQRPFANLASSARRVIGFGLGKFQVSVAASGIRDPGGTIITFESDGAAFEGGNTLTLDSQGTGTLKMRSMASGLATIRALPPFEKSFVEVDFIQPWLFLVLAAAGGVVGALVTRKGRQRWIVVALLGAATGLALTVLYYVNLDWVSGIPGASSLATTGEGLSFALGFLSAFVGTRWIKAAK